MGNSQATESIESLLGKVVIRSPLQDVQDRLPFLDDPNAEVRKMTHDEVVAGLTPFLANALAFREDDAALNLLQALRQVEWKVKGDVAEGDYAVLQYLIDREFLKLTVSVRPHPDKTMRLVIDMASRVWATVGDDRKANVALDVALAAYYGPGDSEHWVNKIIVTAFRKCAVEDLPVSRVHAGLLYLTSLQGKKGPFVAPGLVRELMNCFSRAERVHFLNMLPAITLMYGATVDDFDTLTDFAAQLIEKRSRSNLTSKLWQYDGVGDVELREHADDGHRLVVTLELWNMKGITGADKRARSERVIAVMIEDVRTWLDNMVHRRLGSMLFVRILKNSKDDVGTETGVVVNRSPQ